MRAWGRDLLENLVMTYSEWIESVIRRVRQGELLPPFELMRAIEELERARQIIRELIYNPSENPSWHQAPGYTLTRCECERCRELRDLGLMNW